MGAKIPKQNIKLENKALFEITAERFNLFSCIDDIIFVGNKIFLDKYYEKLKKLKKIKGVLPGGKERSDSVFAGLLFCTENPPDFVVIHDVVRPFVSEKSVEKSINAAALTGASAVALPSVDTIYEVENGMLVSVPDRGRMYNVQTPQTFSFSKIMDIHKKFRRNGGKTTDDASLAHRFGIQVTIVGGNSENIKITSPSDISLAAAIYKRLSEVK